MTRVLDCTKESIALAVELIKKGELVAFPTETVYGLGADAFNEDAVTRIFQIKRRPFDNPLIVHCADEQGILRAVDTLPAVAKKLIEAFMPGALTLILKKNAALPKAATCGLDTVGVRIPNHRGAREFLRAADTLIAAPSANLSTRPSPTTANHVFCDLNNQIPLILDGGECAFGIESTVLDLSSAVPRILRPGSVDIDSISALIGRVEMGGKEGAPKSPGQKYKHYSPDCTVLYAAFGDKMAIRIAHRYDIESAKGARVGIFCLNKNAHCYADRQLILMGEDNGEAAHNIYSLFRRYEKKLDVVIIEGIVADATGKALINRIEKACGGNII